MAVPKVSPDAITPSPDIIQIATADGLGSQDIDVATLYNGGAACRRIRVETAGAGTKLLVLETVASKAAGTTRTLTVTDGWVPPDDCQILTIKSTSTVTRVTIMP